MKKLLLALLLSCSIIEHHALAQLPSGTVRKPVYTDAGGTNVSGTVTLTNQWLINVDPTNTNSIPRKSYVDNALATLSNALASANFPVNISTNGVHILAGATNLNLVGFSVNISGRTALVSNQTASASGPIVAVTKQVFTSSGTYTPTTGMSFCIVEAVGSGGGGWGSNDSTWGGGGGGAGGYARATLTAAQIGASKAVTIGAAGTGNGDDGADCSLGSLVVAKAGRSGTRGSSSTVPGNGGAGGGLGTGDFTSSGGSGFCGVGGNLGGITRGGQGGASWFGGGGMAQVNGGYNNGSAFGSGGSGGVTVDAAGSGKAGVVIVTEFLTQ